MLSLLTASVPMICLQAKALGKHLQRCLSGQQLEGMVFSSTAVRAVDTARIALDHVAVSRSSRQLGAASPMHSADQHQLLVVNAWSREHIHRPHTMHHARFITALIDQVCDSHCYMPW